LIVITLALLFQRDGRNPGYLAQIAHGLGLEGVGDFLFRISFIHLFFLFLPVYFLSLVLYIAFASIAGARERYPEAHVEEAAAGEPRRAAAPEFGCKGEKRPVNCSLLAPMTLHGFGTPSSIS